MIRVGVVGAAGRMGREVARAVTADPGLELVAAVDPSHAGQVVEGTTIADTLDALAAAGAEVAVEFTRPTEGPANISWCVEHGIHVVSGTTGFDPDPSWSEQRDVGVFIAPNFAIGAVLMQRFAEQAVRYLPDAEIIELHHHDKPDAPSGTAIDDRQAHGRGARRRRRRRRAGHGTRSPAPAGETSTASTSTRYGCPGWSRTRRSSSAARGRRSRSVTTPPTGRRSCRAS